MTTVSVIEQALEVDPLAGRLSTVQVGPVPERLRAAAVAARPDAAPRRRRRLFLGAGAAAVVLATLTVTPVGATLAHALLPPGIQQRLGLFEGAPSQLTTPGGPAAAGQSRSAASAVPCSQVPMRPGTGVPHAMACHPDLSLAAAQRLVDFTIPTPGALPGGLTYRGALVGIAMGHPSDSVLLTYRDAGGTRSLGLVVVRGTPMSGSGVPSGTVVPVEVNGRRAYYVHGSYGDDGPGTPVTWQASADVEELTWQQGGFTYTLSAAGLHFAGADLIRIAESVR